jgi:hypothetical protein
VLLASQIEITALGPLVGVGAAITAVLVAIRIATVAIATIRSSYSLRERVFMMTVFPRGIVAVSLATYYATQLPAWDIRGGGVLAGTAFLVIIFTVLISSGASLICAKAFRLTMPSVVVIGISSRTVDLARRLAGMGYLVRLTDDEERRIAFGRAHDLECEYTESAARVYEIVAANRARIAILARPHRWPALRSQDLPKGVSAFSLGEDRAGWRTMPDDFSEDLQALLA